MGVSKCNIIGLVIDKVNALKWGIVCDSKDNDDLILDNYADFLNCTTIPRDSCNPDNCINPTIVVVCNLVISSILYSIDINTNTVTFTALDLNITGGNPPYSYTWGFNSNDFTNAGSINSNVLVLSLKPNKSFNTLVSQITLHVVDINNCFDDDTCYLTPISLRCDSYIACPNPIDLQIINKYIRCSGAKQLVVTNKN